MKKNLSIILIVLLTLSLTNCKKEETTTDLNSNQETVESVSKKPAPTIDTETNPPEPTQDTDSTVDDEDKNTEPTVDALSYNMELTLDTDNKTLNEIVSIEFENNTEKALSELCIRDMTPEILKYCEEFYPENNNNLKTQINSITSNSTQEQLEYTYGKDQSIILVSLGKNTIEPGEKYSLTINMKTDIPNRGDRFGYRETEQGTLFALSFCFPYIADNINGEWNTDPYFDDGENRSSDIADYIVKLHTPKDYTIAIPGNETTENGVTTVTTNAVRDFAIVACNFMTKESFTVDDITVNSYYFDGKEDKTYRAATKATATDSLKIFNEKIGKYPYTELDIVPCLFGFGYGGMEYPGLIMINASGFYDGPFFDAISHEDKISHEIAHQWFYSAVGNNEYREAWIDEGFTTLMEKDIYGLTPCDAHDVISEIEEDYPDITMKEQNRTEMIEYAREYYEGIYLNIAPDEFPEDRYYGDAEYYGSYAFLEEVRILIGDEAFMKMLQEYYETFYMKTVKTQDVLDFIKTYDNSEKLNEIIEFYFK